MKLCCRPSSKAFCSQTCRGDFVAGKLKHKLHGVDVFAERLLGPWCFSFGAGNCWMKSSGWPESSNVRSLWYPRTLRRSLVTDRKFFVGDTCQSGLNALFEIAIAHAFSFAIINHVISSRSRGDGFNRQFKNYTDQGQDTGLKVEAGWMPAVSRYCQPVCESRTRPEVCAKIRRDWPKKAPKRIDMAGVIERRA